MSQPSASSPSKAAVYEAGTIIADKYRLERLLGEGGQACVWEARNLSLDVDVAIKFVAPAVGNDDQIARLLLEGRTAARLHHPAIVSVFDFGQTPRGDSFLVMELLQGQSLAQLLETSERLTPEYALRLLLPVAEAISMAHASGVVHRDIKPDNIFLSSCDQQIQPKLLDFGVARVDSTAAVVGRLTCAGAVVGTPAYLSPEQARGETNIDHRADIWSFSATLYECITGEVPFSASTSNALLWTIVESQPVSTVELGAGDAALWAIIQRGLSKSREGRWPSMRDLGRALGEWLASRGVSDDILGVPLSTRWRGQAGLPSSPPCAVDRASYSETVATTVSAAESVRPMTMHLVASPSARSHRAWLRRGRAATTLTMGLVGAALALFTSRFAASQASEAVLLAKLGPYHSLPVAGRTAPAPATTACAAGDRPPFVTVVESPSPKAPEPELAMVSAAPALAATQAAHSPSRAALVSAWQAHRANHVNRAKPSGLLGSTSEERQSRPAKLEAPDAELMAVY